LGENRLHVVRRRTHQGSEAATISRKFGFQQACYLIRVERQKLSGAIMSPLMTYQEAANYLQISLATIDRLVRAAECRRC
jgi:hypothetical protein